MYDGGMLHCILYPNGCLVLYECDKEKKRDGKLNNKGKSRSHKFL